MSRNTVPPKPSALAAPPSPSAEFELARCRRQLRDHVLRIDALLDVLGYDIVLFHPARGRAEALYREVKLRLRDDLRARRPRGSTRVKASVDARFLLPWLRSALSRLEWPLHSIPGRRWIPALSDARLDLGLGIETIQRELRVLRRRRNRLPRGPRNGHGG